MGTITLLVVQLAAGLSCGKKESPAPVKTTPVEAKPVTTPPVEAPPTAATAATGSGTVGVAACDDWLKKYTACIDSRVPPAARRQMRDALAQTAATWKRTASTAEGRASVETACGRMVESTKQATVSFGCDW